MNFYKLYQYNCLEIMPTINSDSIDLVFLDPPYNIGKDVWDKIEDYHDWMGKVFKECERALKPNGSMYVCHNQMSDITRFMLWLEENTEFIFKAMITWDKYQGNKQHYGRNMLMAVNNGLKRNYCPTSEYILFYTFQENDVTVVTIRDYLRKEKNKSGLTNKEFNLMFSEYTNKVGDVTRSVIERYWSERNWRFPTKEIYENILQKTGYFKTDYNKLRKKYDQFRYKFNCVEKDVTRTWLMKPTSKKDHLTPKPKELIRRIIKYSTNEGDTVLDPFIGSGTTMEVCQNLRRNCIGIEKNHDYINSIKTRCFERQFLDREVEYEFILKGERKEE